MADHKAAFGLAHAGAVVPAKEDLSGPEPDLVRVYAFTEGGNLQGLLVDRSQALRIRNDLNIILEEE